MENASKALIIAGAILLSILIISLGIMIFNQAQDAMGNGGMSDAEVTAFNNKFIKYEGRQKGSTLKNLIQEVNVNNAQDSDNIVTMLITYTSNGTPVGDQQTSTTAQNYTTSDIINTHTYTITVSTAPRNNNNNNNGRVTHITVTY